MPWRASPREQSLSRPPPTSGSYRRQSVNRADILRIHDRQREHLRRGAIQGDEHEPTALYKQSRLGERLQRERYCEHDPPQRDERVATARPFDEPPGTSEREQQQTCEKRESDEPKLKPRVEEGVMRVRDYQANPVDDP